MLRNVKILQGYALRAHNGDLGIVQDFYFDDASWTIRYLIADTGKLFPGRQVLIGPEALGRPDFELSVFPVNLTTEQIEQSPGIEKDQPVSKQKEQALRSYYQWPMYGGTLEMPFMATPTGFSSTVEKDMVPEDHGLVPQGDKHLRSINEVLGYGIHARDGELGEIVDCIVEDETWTIQYVVVDTGKWLPGKKVLIAQKWIDTVSWEKSVMDVNLTKEQVKNCPEYNPAIPINKEYEVRLYDYYGRPKDW